MKGLYLILLLAGNLFSQTDSIEVWITTEIDDGGWINITDGTATATFTTIDFQDCQGDDLMFNYVSGQIQEIDRASFGDRQASYCLIQAPEVLKAYQWMRRNRGNKYTIHQMVVRVNRWYQGGD